MAERKPTKHAPNFKDLTAIVFGRLVVIELSPETRGGDSCWLCACECGNETVVRGSCLRNGMTRSCGCYRHDQTSAANRTHGKSGTREYGVWKQAKNRCFSPAVKGYLHYGARGITMCDEWKNDFAAFYRDMGPCPPGFTLERIDNNSDYRKDNCKWATRTEQARNTRDATYVTRDGLTLSLPAWAERLGIKYKTLHRRHRKGLPLFAPLQRPGRKAKSHNA